MTTLLNDSTFRTHCIYGLKSLRRSQNFAIKCGIYLNVPIFLKKENKLKVDYFLKRLGVGTQQGAHLIQLLGVTDMRDENKDN